MIFFKNLVSIYQGYSTWNLTYNCPTTRWNSTSRCISYCHQNRAGMKPKRTLTITKAGEYIEKYILLTTTFNSYHIRLWKRVLEEVKRIVYIDSPRLKKKKKKKVLTYDQPIWGTFRSTSLGRPNTLLAKKHKLDPRSCHAFF